MADTAITLESKYISKFLNPERHDGYTHAFRIPHHLVAVGSGSTDTVTVTLANTPANWAVTKAKVDVPTAFDGTAGTFTIQVGQTTTYNNYITATTVKTAGPIVSAVGASPATLAGSFGAASVPLRARFTNASSGAPEDLTAGEAIIYLQIEERPSNRG